MAFFASGNHNAVLDCKNLLPQSPESWAIAGRSRRCPSSAAEFSRPHPEEEPTKADECLRSSGAEQWDSAGMAMQQLNTALGLSTLNLHVECMSSSLKPIEEDTLRPTSSKQQAVCGDVLLPGRMGQSFVQILA